jgi:hypothetical protein
MATDVDNYGYACRTHSTLHFGLDDLFTHVQEVHGLSIWQAIAETEPVAGLEPDEHALTDIVDPFTWVVRDTGQRPRRRHLQTCWHFDNENVPVVCTSQEMRTVPTCMHCRGDVERRETALQLAQRLAGIKRELPGYQFPTKG